MKKIFEKIKLSVSKFIYEFEAVDWLGFCGMMIFVFAVIGFIDCIRWIICLL